MRIPPIAIQPLAREHGKPPLGRGHAATNAASGPDTPAPSQAAVPTRDWEPSAKAVERGEHRGHEHQDTPPGLERVLARREHSHERNAGQARAFDRISRNIERYRETQALGTPPAPVAPPTAAAPETAAGMPASTDATEPVNTAATTTPPGTPAPAEELATSTSTTPTGSDSASA